MWVRAEEVLNIQFLNQKYNYEAKTLNMFSFTQNTCEVNTIKPYSFQEKSASFEISKLEESSFQAKQQCEASQFNVVRFTIIRFNIFTQSKL